MTKILEQELNWPLMENNITREDLDKVIDYLKLDDPKLTHGPNVRAFEEEWSEWLGVKHSVYVNSGASANLLTMAIMREIKEVDLFKESNSGNVIVPPLTWASDISSVIQNRFIPKFVDINRRNLALDDQKVLKAINSDTEAVFLTHVLGYNGLTESLLDGLKKAGVPLLEDVCESHGTTFNGKKLGTFGEVSNFSFYYAHHLSTIEGGMICTDDIVFYEIARMLRSHGMVRELSDEDLKKQFIKDNSDLNPDFIFAAPGYNVRPNEIGAIIGRSQLKRLDENNQIRTDNLKLFLDNLDSKKYQTDFEIEGSSNYAFTLVLNEPDKVLWTKVESKLRGLKVEFRRGLSGGGNQLRQPYLENLIDQSLEDFPNVEHIHFYSCYIGNYPTLEKEKILRLTDQLNKL